MKLHHPHYYIVMGGATGGCGCVQSSEYLCGCGWQCPPTFGTRGYKGGGAVQWKWSLLLQQTVFIQYCTSDRISTPLTLVDTCQVNDIWKDGLGRVSTVHPTGQLHQWRSQGGTLVHAPPSSERLNGLALMTIHKDIHFKHDDVIDQYVMQQNCRLQCE